MPVRRAPLRHYRSVFNGRILPGLQPGPHRKQRRAGEGRVTVNLSATADFSADHRFPRCAECVRFALVFACEMRPAGVKTQNAKRWELIILTHACEKAPAVATLKCNHD